MDLQLVNSLMSWLLFLFGPNQENKNQTKTARAPPARQMIKGQPEDLRNLEYPLVTEMPWPKINLSETDPEGFIVTRCYSELVGREVPVENLFLKKFRIVMKRELEEKNKLCMLRFPTGVRLKYRFRFNDPNTFVFFAYGHSVDRTVATSRKISRLERHGIPDKYWRGTMHIPCNFSTLVFRPFAVGENFEFRILDGHNYVDKCSRLEEQYESPSQSQN